MDHNKPNTSRDWTRGGGSVRRRWMGLALAGVAVLTAAGTAGATFQDTAGHWANSVVSLLEARGLVSGDEAARFMPDAPLTRGQLAKLLVTGLGHEADAAQLKGAPTRFADLPATHWAAGWVEALAELGVTAGYPDGTFHPDEPLTRAEAAVLLARAIGLPAETAVPINAPLPFRDTAVIPGWAIRSVQVTVALDLLQGGDSGLFRPNAPLTRAEGSAILYRLMTMQGRLIHLSGTLVDWSPATREGTVRDALGTERKFRMAADASLFQAGRVTSWAGVRQLDQVWVVLGPNGEGRYLEARYRDLVGQDAHVAEWTLNLTVDGQTQRLAVQPGALIYVNGRPASLAAVEGAAYVYAALDWMTGEVRSIDAIRATNHGTLGEVVGDGPEFYLQIDGEWQLFRLAPGVNPYLLGTGWAPLTALPVGSHIYLEADEKGLVRYLFAQR
jgi:hypothetical protein